eukprot:IDg2489t1
MLNDFDRSLGGTGRRGDARCLTSDGSGLDLKLEIEGGFNKKKGAVANA